MFYHPASVSYYKLLRDVSSGNFENRGTYCRERQESLVTWLDHLLVLPFFLFTRSLLSLPAIRDRRLCYRCRGPTLAGRYDPFLCFPWFTVRRFHAFLASAWA